MRIDYLSFMGPLLLNLMLASPFAGALLVVLAARRSRSAAAWTAAAVMASGLVALAPLLPAALSGDVLTTRIPWLPEWGLDFALRLDGLGLLFTLLILGIGLLIVLYAAYYMPAYDRLGRFYALLLAFAGGMLGVVLAENTILMLVFWEITSLTSFLLIAYKYEAHDARIAARMALAVTGGGGLALLAGLLLLGNIAGSFELSVILAKGDLIRAHPYYPLMLVLVLLGAFTKSGQFPFHFWLPNAMAAPTPVSAYLHSATMVKAGVFLLARLWPALAGTDMWFLTVTSAGLVTMIVGAWIAIFKDDLKALLAFSTVSHLGLMVMLLGFGTPMAAIACAFHILNHATFKAPLFMSAGIVDHEAHTRDIRRLGGLMTLMPITATLALVAAASMAGIPLLNGFLSKEMMLEEASHTAYAGTAWLVPALATLGALLSVAYSARFAIRTFLGPVRDDYPHHPHDPPFGMWLPVVVLVVPVVAIGLLPAIAEPVVIRTATAIVGGPLPEFHLALWHGLTPALFMSLVAIAGGAALFAAFDAANSLRLSLPRPEAKRLFDRTIGALVLASRRFIDASHAGSLQAYAGATIVAVVTVGLVAFFDAPHGAGERVPMAVNLPAVIAWAVLLGAALAIVLRHADRLLTLVLTSVIGLIVSLAFLQFSAPDLALTQISVEVVTTILLLLALNLLPKETVLEKGLGVHLRDGAIALVAGLGIAGIAYAVMTRDFTTISDFHIAQSKPGGGGTNVVNVTLVDFRGFDTFGEIIVLGIAALTIFALLDNALRGAAARRLDAMRQGEEGKDAHPLILVVATRVLLPLALTVAAYIFLRGHNQPGGGFIAGLIVAIAYIMQYIASGYTFAADRARVDAQAMIGAGIIVAGLTGIGAWLFGAPFLTSTFGYVHLPVVGEFELASAMGFDTGVFLTVVGAVMLSLAQISRVEQRAEREPVPEGPMDIKLKPEEMPLPVPAATEGAGE